MKKIICFIKLFSQKLLTLVKKFYSTLLLRRNKTKKQNTNQQKTKLVMYLLYAAITILIINFVLAFIPFVKVYQPSYSKTLFGETTYGGWFIDSASMAKFIFPLIFILPYAFSIGSFVIKREKSPFVKILKNEVRKPPCFISLLLAAFANLISMFILFIYLKSEVSIYEEHGAYCHFTVGGILSIIFTVALVLVLLFLSHLSTRMITTMNETTNEKIEGENK